MMDAKRDREVLDEFVEYVAELKEKATKRYIVMSKYEWSGVPESFERFVDELIAGHSHPESP